MYSMTTHVRWRDLDSNAHMANSAYLDIAVDCRLRYFADSGFSVGEFARLGFGPVVRRDEVDYAHELGLLDVARATLSVCGRSEDGSRFRLRNRILRDQDETLAATVTTTGGWLDLRARKLRVPPPEIAALLSSLEREPDFETLPSIVR